MTTFPPQACSLFAPMLNGLHAPAEIAAFLKDQHGQINSAETLRSSTGMDLLAHNTALVDAVLRRLFTLAVERAGSQEEGENVPALAIVATGGYGRRELAPFSDVDVTFVPALEDDPYLNILIQDMFQMVMDVFLYGANLKVGYAYRLIGELKRLDHQTQTTLLDARFLCGDKALFTEFRTEFRAHLLTADFLFQKWAERQSVLAKHGGDQVYGVEPNVKEGAGGLRDIQNAEWMGEVRCHAGLSQVWPVLVEQGMVTREDAAQIKNSRDFLHCTRAALHLAGGLMRDSLSAEKQEEVAALLGYMDQADTPAVEAFMRDYFLHAAQARRIARKVIFRCLDSELPLGPGLASIRRELTVIDPEAARKDLALPLHVAELAQAYGLAVSDVLNEEIPRFFQVFPRPADMEIAGRVFTRLLAAGRGVAEALERQEETGTLSWLIPEFGPLMTLIPYDAAHEFTVGAHSLHVVRNLELLKTNTDFPEGRRIFGEVAHPEILYLAGLLHDIGKQWPHGSHAETGAEAAREICERLGWDTERRDKVVFLIRNHLLMAETSRLRDLALEETIREFVRHVPDMDCLHMLYLLTYADTAAVGVGIWTEVQGRFLAELYGRSEFVLSGPLSEDGSQPPPVVPDLKRQRERIRKGLAQHNLPTDIILEHTRNLPAQYLLNTPLEDMYLHIAMIGRLRETFEPSADFKNEYGADYTELTLCAYDDPKPGLLAKITGVLYAHDVNLHTAQVFTREASVRIAIDTLWIDYRGKPLSTHKRGELQASLRRVLLGEIGVGELLQSHKKPLKEQTIYAAKIDENASERFSLLEVSAPDETGVVYRLSRAISDLGWNIHAARLSVWGSRARDAFYVTGQDGNKVPSADVSRLLAALPQEAYSKQKRR
jgi:[protein-PII] uridylyltransferase